MKTHANETILGRLGILIDDMKRVPKVAKPFEFFMLALWCGTIGPAWWQLEIYLDHLACKYFPTTMNIDYCDTEDDVTTYADNWWVRTTKFTEIGHEPCWRVMSSIEVNAYLKRRDEQEDDFV
jgi:hypothetical protein